MIWLLLSVFEESIKQARWNAAIFSSSLPICPIYFHLVMPRHVFSPCYARYEHTRGIKGYVTYYLTCYVRLWVQNMLYCMRLRVQNMAGCHLRNNGRGKWADWRKKNRSNTFVLTAFISFGLFNICRVFDWPIIIIDPNGLLLVVPHLFAVPVFFFFYRWGLQKSI